MPRDPGIVMWGEKLTPFPGFCRIQVLSLTACLASSKLLNFPGSVGGENLSLGGGDAELVGGEMVWRMQCIDIRANETVFKADFSSILLTPEIWIILNYWIHQDFIYIFSFFLLQFHIFIFFHFLVVGQILVSVRCSGPMLVLYG